MDEKHIGFIIQDEDSGLDSVVYVHVSESTINIRCSQRLEYGLMHSVIPYVLMHYVPQEALFEDGFRINYMDGDSTLQGMYDKYKENSEETGEGVHELTDILEELAYFYTIEHQPLPKPTTRMSGEYVPDFKNMDDQAYKRWMDYFMSRGLDDDGEEYNG